MDFKNKNSMEIRLLMKEQGWDSKDRLTEIGWGGKYGYSIWFEKWEWHGRSTLKLTGDKVCFHRHTDDLTEIDAITSICAEQCIKAYEDFTDSIPTQNAKNQTVSATMYSDWNDKRVLNKKNKDVYNK